MNRYWVGGTGNWTASDTTNWSASSGGAGGASAPTSADDVFFDAGSDAGGIFTVTIGTGAVCRDISASALDFTMTLAGSAAWSIYGSLSFPATNLSATYTGIATLRATTIGKTITTNGITLANSFIFDGVGGEWTLGGALTVILTLQVNNGNFITNNFNVSSNVLRSNVVGTRGLTLGSSIVTTVFNGAAIDFANTSGLTFNAGTSQINCSAASPTFTGGGLTYYNVSFTSASAGTVTITGANTFNNLTFTSLAATGIRNISVGANQTVNGTLTLGTANTAIRRMFMRSDTIGTPRTITAAAIAALADVDFRDIVAAGASGTWSGTRLGNCLGNSNITFDASKSVYRIGTGNWSATQWALSSGGAVDVNNFPLAQDDCIFDGSTTTGTHTVDAGWNIGNLDFSALTVAVTWATGTTAPAIYENLTLDSDVTISGTGALTFAGTSNQTITSAGKTFTQPITVNKTGSFIMADALTSNGVFTLTRGTLDLNNFDLTAFSLLSNNSNTRSIAFGTGKIYLTGNNVGSGLVSMLTATNFTRTGTPDVYFTYSGSVGTRIFAFGNAAGGSEANALNLYVTGGTDNLQVYSHVGNLILTGFNGTYSENGKAIYGDLVLSSGMTISASTNTTSFAKSTGTQTVATNGVIIDNLVAKNNVGTLQLLDALTMGSTRTLAHLAGTIDINDFTLTTVLYSSTGSTARQLDVGAGSFVNTGATFTVSGSNYTTAGTGSISMTSASAKTFAGGGFSYPELNQGGAGDLSVTGTNTFANITNTTQPAIIKLPASTITNCANVNTAGDATNQLTIQSSSNGVQATINLTAADVDTKYTTFKDVKVTGNYKFNAYTQSGTADSIGNVNNGNNSNITFTPTGGLFMVVM